MTKAKKPSTEVAVLTPEEQAYLDSIRKETAKPEYSGPARLMINELAKDENGNKQVIGSWHIQGTDKYFDGPIKFRPIRTYHKLIRYSVDAKENYTLAGQSVYFSNFFDEIPDSLGGNALGRTFGNKNLTQEERDKQRELAETYMNIFGLVTFGDDEPYPVVYRVRGSKIVDFSEAFNSLPKGKDFTLYNYELETYQPTDEKTGKAKSYWSVKITPDLSEPLPIAPILAYDAEIQEFIKEENLRVLEEHKQNKVSTGLAKSANTIEIDDELPF